MSLSPKEQFRFAFLEHCINEGLTPEQVRARVKEAMVKIAMGPVAGSAAGSLLASGVSHVPAKIVDLAKYLTAFPLQVGALGLVGATGAGMGAGYLGAKMTEEDVDPNEAKKQELIAAYKQQAERARRNAARASYRQVPSKVRSATMF